MKATVYYRELNERATRRTIEVEKNEPNSIVREFVKVTGVSKYSTYISHIKCGRYDYQWLDTCKSAYAELF